MSTNGDLFRLLRRHPVLPEQEVRSFTLQVVRAVARLHRRSMVHRDIKPENILLDVSNRGGVESRGDSVIQVMFPHSSSTIQVDPELLR